MRIGIDIDNTLTDIEDESYKALYDYAIKLGKKINFSTIQKEQNKLDNSGSFCSKNFL